MKTSSEKEVTKTSSSLSDFRISFLPQLHFLRHGTKKEKQLISTSPFSPVFSGWG